MRIHTWFRRASLLFLAGPAAALLLPVPAGAAQWVRVETPNFVVFGEVGEKRTREVAAEFERFREALGRVLRGAATQAPVPTTVVVFGSRKSFAPYRPLYNGKAIELAGYFSSDRDMNRVALVLEDREQGLRTIFHEYVHLVVSNVTENIPPWLNEGLAEYYSTFLVSDDGKTATIGKVIVPHLQLLNEQRPIPLADLLAVTHDSPLYNEGQRRGMFYAQSWALVHFLLSGEPNHSKELGEYLRVVGSGVPAAPAWAQTFGAYDPLPDMRRYVQQFAVRGFRYRFSEGIDPVKGAAATLPDAEVEATLGDELLGVQRTEDAEEHLKKAIALPPSSARAKALLGLVRAERDSDEAARLLMEAAADRRDWLTQYYVAAGLASLVRSTADEVVPARIEAATRAIADVLAVRPDLPHALALQGRLAMATRKDLDAAALAVGRARGLSPGREDYAFLEATLHMVRRDYRAARDILAPMMSGRYPERIRDQARMLMGQAVTFEQRERDAGPARRTIEVPATAGQPDGVERPLPEQPAMQPIYRTLAPGEERTEGRLERIACAGAAATLEVRTDSGLVKFAVTRLDQVDFISYRASLSGAIGCGARTPPDHVFVTWRDAGAQGAKGRAVAVEFLPK